MNRHNVETVRDALLAYSERQERPRVPGDGKLGFQMAWPIKTEPNSIALIRPELAGCGAAGCLIAWTNILCGPAEDQYAMHLYGDQLRAQKLLDIDKEQAENLFYPSTRRGLYDLTAADAAHALTVLLDDNVVDWPEGTGFTYKHIRMEDDSD